MSIEVQKYAKSFSFFSLRITHKIANLICIKLVDAFWLLKNYEAKTDIKGYRCPF